MNNGCLKFAVVVLIILLALTYVGSAQEIPKSGSTEFVRMVNSSGAATWSTASIGDVRGLTTAYRVGDTVFLNNRAWVTDTTPQLFKPGGRLEAGTEVKDLYGSVWRINIPIAVAVTPPSTSLKDSKGRAYYSYLRSGEASTVTAPFINVLDYGILPTNTGIQNSDAMDKLLASLPAGSTDHVHIPTGHYQFAREILLFGKPIHLTGDNGTIFSPFSTRLIFPPGVNGIVVMRGPNSYQDGIIERLCIISNPNSTTWASGIASKARLKIRDCTVKGFSHNGIDFWASIEGEGTDASGSLVEGCHSLENAHDGFFAGRTDANAITFIGNDARNNGQYGFNDDSFLGNYYISNMCHENAKGHYYVRDKGNARTTIIAAYCEGGSPPSQLSPLTTVVGGIWASGYSLDGKTNIYK